MIYVTGDIHGEYWRCDDSYFPEQNEMTKNDYLIICGDFGGIWAPVEGLSEKVLFELSKMNLANFKLTDYVKPPLPIILSLLSDAPVVRTELALSKSNNHQAV